MSNRTIGLSDELQGYLLAVGVREPDVLRRLREETARLPERDMQIAPEQGAFMAFLVEVLGAVRCLELGTFTGYSSLSVALALPPGGRIVCCDVSREWTEVARRYWDEAGVSERVELRLGRALETLDELLGAGGDGTFDFAFLDADKRNYPTYYELILRLLRPGGVLAVDNVLWGGDVVRPEIDDEDVRAVRALNDRVATDERVTVSMLPVADGLTLVRKRA